MAVAQSQGFHLERFASQPTREALGLRLNREAAADQRSVISPKSKQVSAAE